MAFKLKSSQTCKHMYIYLWCSSEGEPEELESNLLSKIRGNSIPPASELKLTMSMAQWFGGLCLLSSCPHSLEPQPPGLLSPSRLSHSGCCGVDVSSEQYFIWSTSYSFYAIGNLENRCAGWLLDLNLCLGLRLKRSLETPSQLGS